MTSFYPALAGCNKDKKTNLSEMQTNLQNAGKHPNKAVNVLIHVIKQLFPAP